MRALPLVYRQLIAAHDLRAVPELLALAVNLTLDRRLAEVPGMHCAHRMQASSEPAFGTSACTASTLLVCQELGSSRERVQQLRDKALPARDALALRLLRNLACNGGAAVGQHIAHSLDDFAALLQVLAFTHTAGRNSR